MSAATPTRISRAECRVRLFIRLPEALLAEVKEEADLLNLEFMSFIELAVAEAIERRRQERR